MSEQRTEFRVRWRREGRGQVTRIYQRWESAYRKTTGILALEIVKHEFVEFETMPDLAEGPVIEVRSVGLWAPNEFQVEEVSDLAKRRMAEWIDFRYPRQPVGAEDSPF